VAQGVTATASWQRACNHFALLPLFGFKERDAAVAWQAIEVEANPRRPLTEGAITALERFGIETERFKASHRSVARQMALSTGTTACWSLANPIIRRCSPT